MTEEIKGVPQLRERQRDWERLLSNPAWGQLIETLQAQADALQKEVLYRPLTCDADVYQRERQAGRLIGLLSVTDTVMTLQSEIEVEIDRLKQGDSK